MKLAKRVPTMNQEAKKQLEAGRLLQTQRAAQQIPTGMSAVRAAQQIAPMAQQQAGEQQLAQQQQAGQQMAQLAGAGLAQQQQQQQMAIDKQALQQQEQLQQQGLGQQMALSREELQLKNALTDEELASAKRLSQYGIDVDAQLSSMSRKQREDLASLGGDVKAKLFDANLAFDKNELGRKFNNHRQLLKAAVSNAKSDQDLKTKLNIMQQESAKEMILLESAHKQMIAALERGYLDEKRELDQAQRIKLTEMVNNIKKKLRRKKQQSAMTSMIVTGAFTVGGAVVGSVVPGAGTMAGATVGSGVGQIVSGATQ